MYIYVHMINADILYECQSYLIFLFINMFQEIVKFGFISKVFFCEWQNDDEISIMFWSAQTKSADIY